MRRASLAAAVSILAFTTLASCKHTDDTTTPEETQYAGSLYNSNDGHCTVTGQLEDFYMDGRFVATIAAGRSSPAELSAGPHAIRVLLTGSGQVLEAGYSLTITGHGWWYWHGCADGTHPSSAAPVHVESAGAARGGLANGAGTGSR